MNAAPPPICNKEPSTLRKKKPLNPFSLFLLIVIAATGIQIGDKWYSVEKENELLKKQLEPYEEAEQYALLANRDGWYECCNCPAERVFLLRGEVWKYGATIKKNRYTESFLEQNQVEYIVQFEGDLTACRKEEIRKIRMYKFSTENRKREVTKRLVRPPGNCRNS